MTRIISSGAGPGAAPVAPDGPSELSSRQRRGTLLTMALAFSLWLLVVVMTGNGISRSPPGSDPPWERLTQAVLDGQPVTLPYRADPLLDDPRWLDFRIPVQVRESRGRDLPPLGICVNRWSLTAEVSLDGQVLARSADRRDLGAEYSRLHADPLPPALSQGTYELTIRVLAWPGMDSGLSEIWVGEAGAIAQACASASTSRWLSAYGAQLLVAVLGLASAVLFATTRERAALWFFATAFTWAVHGRHFLQGDILQDTDTWILTFLATRELFVLTLMLFTYALVRREVRYLAPMLAGLGLAALLALALMPAAGRAYWLVAVAAAAALGLAWSLGVVLLALRTNRSLALPAMALALATLLGSTLLDTARWAGWTNYSEYSRSYALALLPTFGLVMLLVERLLQHRARDSRAMEWMRAEIERQRGLITEDMERISQQRERLLAANERRRMVQDLHDVLGSQLLSASVLLKDSVQTGRAEVTAQASGLVERALMDLRGALDVLSLEDSDDPDDDPVSTLLGTMRRRLTGVFEVTGMALRWECDALPARFLARTAHRIELVRLLHEALANVLKHSQAREVEVRASMGPGGAVVISVHDDGVGFDPETRSGIGLGSMRRRAQVIGATLRIESGPGAGTWVGLRWPPAA